MKLNKTFIKINIIEVLIALSIVSLIAVIIY